MKMIHSPSSAFTVNLPLNFFLSLSFSGIVYRAQAELQDFLLVEISLSLSFFFDQEEEELSVVVYAKKQ